jgi:phospholipid/cholesterol/gamma-HCH transport system substrate-binding protein
MSKRDIVTGVVIVGAAIGLGVAKGWLNRSWEERNSTDFRVAFDDAKGLKGGEEVRVAGFQVGSVKEVRLSDDGRKAITLLRINDGVKIPLKSQISVSSGLLGGGAVVTIIPSREMEFITEATTKEKPLEGEPAAGLDSALAGVSKFTNDDALREDLTATAHNLKLISEKLNKLGAIAALDDPKGDLQATIRNIRATSALLPATMQKVDAVVANAAEVTASAKTIAPLLEKQVATLSKETQTLIKDLDSVMKSGGRIATQTEGLAKEAKETVADSRASIKALLRSANDATAGVAGLTEQLKLLVGDKDLQRSVVVTTANLAKLSDNLVTLSQKLDETAGTLSKTATDPELLTNIKTTVANVKDASGSIKNITARVETLRLPGEKRPSTVNPPSPLKKQPSWYEPGLTGDFLYDTKAERFRLDTNYSVVTGGQLWRVGLTDATERNLVNVQLGQKSGELWTRYGLFGGKLGVGFDVPVGSLQWRLDLQDPNRFTVNTRLRARLNDSAALTFGLDSVGNGNLPKIGLQIRK